MTQEQVKELKKLGFPIVKFLKSTGIPYASVIITESSIRCVTDVASIPTKKKSDLN